MKTLVIGGTGRVGSRVVAGLIKQGAGVRVMSHSPDKLKKLPAVAEGSLADLDVPDTLPAAFKGIDSLFLLNTVGPSETDEGFAAVAAAKAARVKKIVYRSVAMPEGSEKYRTAEASSRGRRPSRSRRSPAQSCGRTTSSRTTSGCSRRSCSTASIPSPSSGRG